MPTLGQKHHLAPMTGSAGGPGMSSSGLPRLPFRTVPEMKFSKEKEKEEEEAEEEALRKILLVLAR